jgi:hypothetical protein
MNPHQNGSEGVSFRVHKPKGESVYRHKESREEEGGNSTTLAPRNSSYQQLLILDSGASSQAPSAASSNETSLLTSRRIAAHSGSMTNMLVVTTTMRMLHRVHSHTTDLGPLVALHTVLVVGTASLQERLVQTATTSDHAHHGTGIRGDSLLGAGRQAHTRLARLFVVANDSDVITRGACERSTVSRLVLYIARNGTLRHGMQGKHVANGQSSCKKREGRGGEGFEEEEENNDARKEQHNQHAPQRKNTNKKRHTKARGCTQEGARREKGRQEEGQ